MTAPPPRKTPSSSASAELSYDAEAEKLAATFRPNRRPIFAALAANLVLGALLLGVPYVRGREIATEQRQHFAELTRCLFGGEVTRAPGLGLPPNERAHYASRVLGEDVSWPLACRAPLKALTPAEAIFLWPGVKQAGADVRATVALLDETLVQLHEARSAGSRIVPERPLAALARLQAALTLMAKATSMTSGIDAEALRLPSSAALPEPARLPLTAAANASTQVQLHGHALETYALDGRGVSWLRASGGKVERERLKRTSLVRGILRHQNVPYVVWATPQARCAERDDRCASRATGIAAHAPGAHAMPTPGWLAGHLAGRFDRSLRIRDDRSIDMLAVGDAAAPLELRHFAMPTSTLTPFAPASPPPSPEAGARTEPAAAPASALHTTTLAVPAGASHDALLTPSGHVLYAVETEGAVISAQLRLNAEPRRAIELPIVTSRDPFASACEHGDVAWFFYGGADAQALVRARPPSDAHAEPSTTASSEPTEATHATPTTTALLRTEVSIRAPFHADDPARDKIKSVCSGDHLALFALDEAHTLWGMACASPNHCEPPRKLATDVADFAVTDTLDSAVLAYSQRAPAREQRLVLIARSGEPRGPAQTPAACWDPARGMCGLPLLSSDGYRVVLAARDGEDLLAIESTDGGRSFVTLTDLGGSKPVFQNALDPLRQHRLRKGLD